MRDKYGSARDFMLTFTPALQHLAAQYPERAYTGTAPSLAQIAACYGRETVTALLCSYLENLNDFSGVREKIEIDQQKELAAILFTDGHFLKISEVLLFFYRLKSACYGSFYGVVDAMRIMEAFRLFLEERRVALAAYERERLKAEQEASNRLQAVNRVTYEEYLEWKKQFIIEKTMKSYSFQELALEYFPDRTPLAASKQLNSWIFNIPDLEDKLAEAGRYKNQKIMTPLQVSILVEFLGEPDKWVKERMQPPCGAAGTGSRAKAGGTFL